MYRVCLWIYVYAISCRKTMKKKGLMLQTMVFVGVVILKTRFNRHIWRIFEIPKALRYLVEFGVSSSCTPCKIFTWNLKMEVLVEIWDDFPFQLIWFLGSMLFIWSMLVFLGVILLQIGNDPIWQTIFLKLFEKSSPRPSVNSASRMHMKIYERYLELCSPWLDLFGYAKLGGIRHPEFWQVLWLTVSKLVMLWCFWAISTLEQFWTVSVVVV